MKMMMKMMMTMTVMTTAGSYPVARKKGTKVESGKANQKSLISVVNIQENKYFLLEP